MIVLFKNENNFLPRIKINVNDKFLIIIVNRGELTIESDSVTKFFEIFSDSFCFFIGNVNKYDPCQNLLISSKFNFLPVFSKDILFANWIMTFENYKNDS